MKRGLSCEMSLARSPQDTPRLQLSLSSLRNLMVSWLVACSSALLFWLSSHSNSLNVQYLVVSTRSPFGWTCGRAWDKGNTTPQRVTCLDSRHKAGLGRAAPTTARRRSDRALERRTSESSASPCRAVPDVLKEPRVDLFQVFSLTPRSPCGRFVSIVTALWESASLVSFNFFRIPMISRRRLFEFPSLRQFRADAP